MESLTNEETKLISQFRMTYKEASEALANTTERHPSDCKPWRKDVVTVHGGRSGNSVLISHDEVVCDAGGDGNATPAKPSNSAFSRREGKGQPRPTQGLLYDPKADATETTLESTEFSESTAQAEEAVLSENVSTDQRRATDHDLARATGASVRKEETSATIVAKPTIVTRQKTPSKIKEQFVPAPVPVAPASSFHSATPSLSNTLMREYDLTYAKARSVIMEAQMKLGNKADQQALERRCRSLVLFKGKEDFRNVVLRSIDRPRDESSKVVSQTPRRTAAYDPQFVGSSAVETMIMNQYKILYSSAKSLTEEAREELGMKPWDNMTEEFKEACDRLYKEKFAAVSKPLWSTGVIADAKSFFESYGSRPFDQEDQVFRRRTQSTNKPARKFGRTTALEICGKNSGSFLNNSATSLGCLDVIDESVEISHGTCIDDENTNAETIHVAYENDDATECSTSSDSIIHLGDVFEAIVDDPPVQPCDSRVTQATPEQREKQPDQSRVERKAVAIQTKFGGSGGKPNAKDGSGTKKASTPDPSPSRSAASVDDKSKPSSTKKPSRTKKSKTTQTPRSASSTSTRKPNSKSVKSDPLTEKIVSDRKASTPVSTIDSSVNSEEHSQKTIRTKNTKKSHSKTKSSTTKRNIKKPTVLPVAEEVSSHSQSSHEETSDRRETPPPKAKQQVRSQPTKKKRDSSKKQGTTAPLSNENEILEAILMSRFEMNSDTARKVASEARKNTNFPEWKKWNALLLAECQKQLEVLDLEISKKDKAVSKRAEKSEEQKPHSRDHGKKDGANSVQAVNVVELTNTDKKNQPPKEPTLKDVIEPYPACSSTSKDQSEADAEDMLEQNTKRDPISALYPPRMTYPQLTGAEAMARPLETLLTRRHGISWSTASHMVKRGRRALDMTDSEAWTPQLEEHCEQEILDGASSVGETAMSYSLADTRSIVVSVAATSQRMDCDTEVGKDWTEHTLDECSQVSRCPSQTNDFVIVEDGSCASEGSMIEPSPITEYNPESHGMKAEIVPNPLGVPQMIYLFHNQFPEVPGDEPLEARVGMPFIRSGTRRSRKKSFLDRMRRSLRRFRKKATGYRPRRLHEDDTECRVQTLTSL